ncbi:MAG: 2-C-methyl-D-erythritol 4-phosphate cytidylyltransferase [Clostridia bacterium]|nr:2-C-methyl-D-erythritol 4-phosphate cytidylyltransferase [Clostridia bacterium]
MRKKTELSVSVVIVAAGKGTRMNMDINKQYIEVQGIPVLARTIKVFEELECIDEIILVVNTQDIIYCSKDIVELYDLNKVTNIVAGGSERQNSVYNGLMEVKKSCDIVLIHDGARPFVDKRSVEESIQMAQEFGASCVAVKVKDTIKMSDDKGFVKATVDRSRLWAIQTPQAFKYEVIIEAHKKAIEDSFLGTDDAMLVERLGYRLKIAEGSYNNIKITTKEDLLLAELICKQDGL